MHKSTSKSRFCQAKTKSFEPENGLQNYLLSAASQSKMISLRLRLPLNQSADAVIRRLDSPSEVFGPDVVSRDRALTRAVSLRAKTKFEEEKSARQ
jgi:hypothetical protein